MRFAHGRRFAPETPAAKRGRKKHYGFSRNNPPPCQAQPNPLKTIQKLLCAVGVVTTRRQPQSGRISALAGREGRLRACMPER